MLNGVVHSSPFGHTIGNCHVEILYCVGIHLGDGVGGFVVLEKEVDFLHTIE